MAALCSKTYFGWGEEGEKISSKGVNRRHREPTRDRYLNVLSNREPATCKIIVYIQADQINFKFLISKCHFFTYITSDVMALFISDLMSLLYLYQICCHYFIYVRSDVIALFMSDLMSLLYLYQI